MIDVGSGERIGEVRHHVSGHVRDDLAGLHELDDELPLRPTGRAGHEGSASRSGRQGRGPGSRRHVLEDTDELTDGLVLGRVARLEDEGHLHAELNGLGRQGQARLDIVVVELGHLREGPAVELLEQELGAVSLLLRLAGLGLLDGVGLETLDDGLDELRVLDAEQAAHLLDTLLLVVGGLEPLQDGEEGRGQDRVAHRGLDSHEKGHITLLQRLGWFVECSAHL